jgi:hypothetical protein
MARCNGYDKEHICTKCERKAQILRDDPSKFYWMMGPAVEHGRCVYFIAAPAGSVQARPCSTEDLP